MNTRTRPSATADALLPAPTGPGALLALLGPRGGLLLPGRAAPFIETVPHGRAALGLAGVAGQCQDRGDPIGDQVGELVNRQPQLVAAYVVVPAALAPAGIAHAVCSSS